MSLPPSPDSVGCVRISDRDLTEIQLHSVESISDLHRTHTDHTHKGGRSPPPPPSPVPSPNGAVHLPVCPSVRPAAGPRRGGQGGRWLCYGVGGATVLIIITLFLIFYFLVQQGGALRSLTEAVARERQAVAAETAQLLRELQALRRNLTAMATARP